MPKSRLSYWRPVDLSNPNLKDALYGFRRVYRADPLRISADGKTFLFEDQRGQPRLVHNPLFGIPLEQQRHPFIVMGDKALPEGRRRKKIIKTALRRAKAHAGDRCR